MEYHFKENGTYWLKIKNISGYIALCEINKQQYNLLKEVIKMTKEELNIIIKNLKEIKDIVDDYCEKGNCDTCIFTNDAAEDDKIFCNAIKLDDSLNMLVKERAKEIVNEAIRKEKENESK